MRFLSLTALATATSAILVPPSASTMDLGAAELDSLMTHLRTLVIGCENCPVGPVAEAAQDGGIQGISSSLVFSLMLDDQGEQEALVLNDIQIWPVQYEAMMGSSGALTIPQLVKVNDMQLSQTSKASYMITYNVDRRGLPEPVDILTLRVQIMELNGELVSNLPSIRIDAMSTSNGRLLIKDIYAEEPAPQSDNVKCEDILCKLRQALKPIAHKFRGCHGRMGKRPAEGMQGQHHPHHGHRAHRMMRHLRAFARHVLLPITIGLFAGITASVMGMIVGHAIVFVYRLCRGRSASYEVVLANPLDEDVDKVWIVYPDGPPSYEVASSEESHVYPRDEKTSESL